MTLSRFLRLSSKSSAILCAVIAFLVFAGAKAPAHAQEPPEDVLEETQAQTYEAPLASPVDAEGETLPAPAANASLPHDLSPMGMYRSADIVVKSVMIGLVVASVLTWTVFLAKSLELAGVKRRLKSDLKALSGENYPGMAGVRCWIGSSLVQAVEAELALSTDESDREGIRERTASRLIRAEADAARRLSAGTGFLATTGSTAPFVGLFGTVWGIMNSFIGISKANTTNLAVVAPGIAEALLATGLGLAAAIPAVVFYNHFVRQIGGVKLLVSSMSAALLRTVSREAGRPSEA